MDRTEVIDGVATRLFEAERKVDEAFAALAALAGYLPTARLEANLALKVGSTAVTKVATALAEIGRARETVVSAHEDFAVVQRAMGMRTTALGGGDKPDPGIAVARAAIVVAA